MVKFELLTGRTHQIRVHCQAVGLPLIGDGLYGWLADPEKSCAPGLDLDQTMGRQALHAASLSFTHPVSGQKIKLTAPLPTDFRQLLQILYQGQSLNV